MTFGKLMAAGCVALVMGSTGAAMADDECTDDMLLERQKVLGEYLQANPEKAAKMDQAVAKVEEKYGGEPPREKQCDAMDELLEEVKNL